VSDFCEQQAPDAHAETLRWPWHPLVDEFPKSLLFVAAFVGACVLAAAAFGNVAYGLLACGLLATGLGRYLLPTEFTLDDRGAASRFLGQVRKVPWSEVRRVSLQAHAVFLSPFETSSRLDSFRGMRLRFAGNAEKVVKFVESRTASTSQSS